MRKDVSNIDTAMIRVDPQAAALLRVEMQLGVIRTSDVAKWADKLIADLQDPPLALLELSSAASANPHDVRSQLSGLAGDASVIDALRIALGRINRELQADPTLLGVFVTGLSQIATELLPNNLPDDLIDILGFEEEYEEARNGIRGDVETVRTNLLEFTSRYLGA